MSDCVKKTVAELVAGLQGYADSGLLDLPYLLEGIEQYLNRKEGDYLAWGEIMVRRDPCFGGVEIIVRVSPMELEDTERPSEIARLIDTKIAQARDLLTEALAAGAPAPNK